MMLEDDKIRDHVEQFSTDEKLIVRKLYENTLTTPTYPNGEILFKSDPRVKPCYICLQPIDIMAIATNKILAYIKSFISHENLVYCIDYSKGYFLLPDSIKQIFTTILPHIQYFPLFKSLCKEDMTCGIKIFREMRFHSQLIDDLSNSQWYRMPLEKEEMDSSAFWKSPTMQLTSMLFTYFRQLRFFYFPPAGYNKCWFPYESGRIESFDFPKIAVDLNFKVYKIDKDDIHYICMDCVENQTIMLSLIPRGGGGNSKFISDF